MSRDRMDERYCTGKCRETDFYNSRYSYNEKVNIQ